MNSQNLADNDSPQVIDDDLNDNYILAITEIGDSFPKVFVAVKEVTGKSTKEAKEIMDSRIPIVILHGSKRGLNSKAIRLQEAGAKVKFFMAND
jgi:ribosomal protein L7/L12